jgi:hypothetical protein
MSNKSRQIFFFAVYGLLGAGILWQVCAVIFSRVEFSHANTHLVSVYGEVERPGRYRVPIGTTDFEILRVAGMRPISDISAFNLMNQVTANETLTVGTRAVPLGEKKSAASARFEFSLGEVSVIARDGRNQTIEDGMSFTEGDRIITDAKGQVEASVNGYSRIDVDNFSELSFEKIGAVEESKNVVEMLQKSGTCWYKMSYSSPGELFRIMTPLVRVTVAGQGADFMMEVKYDEVNVHNIDGLVLVERLLGQEAINLIAGQTATIFADGRPFQVKTLALDISPNDKFSALIKEKTNYMLRGLPFNFVFFGVPGSYYVVNVQYEKGVINVVNLPPKTSVEEYVQGASTLDEALLQGGPVFASTLVERIMDTRIPKYCLLTKESLVRAAAVLGGVSVDVDKKAAGALKTAAGSQKLTNENLIKFMAPGVSGWEEARQRQELVLRAVYDRMVTKNFVVTSVVAAQLVAAMETNIAANDAVVEYQKFASTRSWSLRMHRLPVTPIQSGRMMIQQPLVDQARKLLIVE